MEVCVTIGSYFYPFKNFFHSHIASSKATLADTHLNYRIRKFPGQTEATMSAEVELISTMGEKKSWNRPPIQMEFQVILLTPMEGETRLFSLCFILSIAIWNWIWIVAESLNIHSLFMNCAWSYKKLSFVVFVIGILFQGIAFYCHV